MKKYIDILKSSPFFNGLTEEEILSIAHCIGGHVISKATGEFVYHAGETITEMGFVLSGSILIIQEDVWGHRNILSKCRPGDFFGEPYASIPGTVLNISVAAECTSELFMFSTQKLLTSCTSICSHHSQLIRNLVCVLSNKILLFNDKITHMSKRTTREKLLSYLSAESLRQNKQDFFIPYNRQQLADYLCVERAAMSVELSRLQKEGILTTNKNHFHLSETFLLDQTF